MTGPSAPAVTQYSSIIVFRYFSIAVIKYSWLMEKSLGFVAVQSRGGIVTIPAEARRALRLDEPGAQLEVILRDNDLLLVPYLAVPLEQARHRDGKAPA